MPSHIGYSLPPIQQRPQQFNRVDIAEPSASGSLKANTAQESGSDLKKTQRVTRSREVLDQRFPQESGVDRFRGNTEGRLVSAESESGSIAKLPDQVQAFDPLKARSDEISTFSVAESAALGLTPTQSQESRTETPPINGSGEIQERFEELQSSRVPQESDDEPSPFRPGGPESERTSKERVESEQTRQNQITEERNIDQRSQDVVRLFRQNEQTLNQQESEDANAETNQSLANSAPTGVSESDSTLNREAPANAPDARESNAEPARSREPGEPLGANGEPLSSEEQREVQRLQRRDQEVRTHERAHANAGGAHVRGGVQLSYETGPDGRRYAVDGEVNIDLSPANTPNQTVAKMRQVRSAALAPANPSGADRAVAALASRRELDARAQAAEESKESRNAQAERQASGEPAQRAQESERAGSIEQRENADHVAGAQSVIPDPSFGPRSTGINQQSLAYGYDAGHALSAPADISRPVGAAPRGADLKQTSEESSSPRAQSESPRQAEVARLAIDRGR